MQSYLPPFRVFVLLCRLAARERARQHGEPGRHRVRQLLMGGQIALALVLLVSSGLMLRSFQDCVRWIPASTRRPPPRSVSDCRAARTPIGHGLVGIHGAILDRLAMLPAVTAVSASTCLPLSAGCTQAVHCLWKIELSSRARILRSSGFHAVAGDYFAVMRMRLLRGRGIDRRDVERNEPVAVINEALAGILFPGENPVGRRVRQGNPSSSRNDPGGSPLPVFVSNTRSARSMNPSVPPGCTCQCSRRATRTSPPVSMR